MGFILNSSGVFSRSDVEQLRDQYVALISSDPLSSGNLAVKATSSQGLESVLQDGTVIHVPENTAAIMADCDRLVDIASEPGVYSWNLTATRSDIRNGAKAPKTTNIFAAFNKIAFAEELPSMEHIFYINLNETDLFALNTPVKVLYNDPLFGRATLTFKMSFSARIINPEAFFKTCKARNATLDDYFGNASLTKPPAKEVINRISDALNIIATRHKVPFFEFDAHKKDIKDALNEALLTDWIKNRGMEVGTLRLENITADPQTMAKLAEYQKPPATKTCDFCGTELPNDPGITRCPSCGAPV